MPAVPYERRVFPMELRVEERHRGVPPTIVGHAAVFDQIAGPAGSREMVAPGAFTRTLREGTPVTALWNHNPDFVIASTKNGSLRLSEDKQGLLAEITPIDTPTIRDLVVKPIQDGLVDKMSFGFETVKDEYTTDKVGALRVLRDLTLFDVSPVVFPWYEGTDISTRGRKMGRLISYLTRKPSTRQMDSGLIATIAQIDACTDQLDELVDSLMDAFGIPDPDEAVEDVSPEVTPPSNGEPVPTNANAIQVGASPILQEKTVVLVPGTGVLAAAIRARELTLRMKGLH